MGMKRRKNIYLKRRKNIYFGLSIYHGHLGSKEGIEADQTEQRKARSAVSSGLHLSLLCVCDCEETARIVQFSFFNIHPPIYMCVCVHCMCVCVCVCTLCMCVCVCVHCACVCVCVYTVRVCVCVCVCVHCACVCVCVYTLCARLCVCVCVCVQFIFESFLTLCKPSKENGRIVISVLFQIISTMSLGVGRMRSTETLWRVIDPLLTPLL